MLPEWSNSEFFNFFGLPRELRNEIYSYLKAGYGPESSVTLRNVYFSHRDNRTPAASLHNIRIPQLLTVNSQFSVEYAEQMEETLETLVFQDRLSVMSNPRLVGGVRRVSVVKLRLLLEPGLGAGRSIIYECRNQKDWVLATKSQMDALERMHMELRYLIDGDERQGDVLFTDSVPLEIVDLIEGVDPTPAQLLTLGCAANGMQAPRHYAGRTQRQVDGSVTFRPMPNPGKLFLLYKKGPRSITNAL